MTLLLATVGFAAQSPTATWWFPIEERGQVSRRNWRVPSALDPGSSERKRQCVSTFLAVLAALVATSLALILGEATRFEQQQHDVSPAISKPSADDLLPAAFRHIPEALQRWLRQDDAVAAAAFADPTSLPMEAKTLLGHERIALLDSIQALPPALDRKIGLTFPGSSLADSKPRQATSQSRLARVTVYWPEEGDYYTRSRRSSSGVHLRDGHCAVDPKVIPYGTVVRIPGIGPVVAVDTGSAVISRRAARQAGRTREQRNAIVIDVFCSTRAQAKALAKRIKHFAVVTWQRPVRQSKL
jgi:3D domain